MNFELSAHASEMMEERGIRQDWVDDALINPDRTAEGNDRNIHYFKSIPEFGNRVLHIIVNQDFFSNKVITLFFDRRVRK
jgi:hypothetical protein